MLYCRADGTPSTKYALECLYHSFLTNALLTPRDSHRFIWNRTVNTSGGVGKNVALDLDVEHSNNFVTQSMKHLGPNRSENAVSRICNAESGVRVIVDKTDQSTHRAAGSNAHTHRSTERDLDQLVATASDTQMFLEHNKILY